MEKRSSKHENILGNQTVREFKSESVKQGLQLKGLFAWNINSSNILHATWRKVLLITHANRSLRKNNIKQVNYEEKKWKKVSGGPAGNLNVGSLVYGIP